MTVVVSPVVKYKTITPEEAHVLIKRSKRKNVPTSKKKIDQYARTMIAGKWDPFNSQAISIDLDGNIVNGHQRLMACVQAGAPFKTLFITGVPAESFVNEDTGRSRDAGHFFALLGEPYYMELAAGARALYVWERGSWRGAATVSGAGGWYIPNEELQAEVERRPELRVAADLIGKNKNPIRGRFKVGPVIALHVLSQNHKAHGEFWKELLDRLSVDKKSPPYQLQRRIDQIKARGANLSALTTLALLTKAWNWYASDDWRELSWDPGKEKFPEPTTDLQPALLPPADGPELITTTPVTKKRPRPVEGKPDLKVVPKPEKRKKGPKLRGGLDSASA